jgi:hypothetical protein
VLISKTKKKHLIAFKVRVINKLKTCKDEYVNKIVKINKHMNFKENKNFKKVNCIKDKIQSYK